ncbi:GNAT family N-acetyltransferase [Bacillus siamensis]|nr:GNAT family N-acetyltransferase [Bacillus siamensis]OAZ69436.1 hypothetical protein SRCM100169_00402 [Bacillus siamensis]
MDFKRINLNKHKETAVSFRKDSFLVSFGTADHFNKDEYLRWLSSQIKSFPGGFVLLFHNGQPIGQLEASIKPYRDQKIGYVHLYYITERQRGMGYGTKLHQYRISFSERTVFRNIILEFLRTIKRPCHSTKSKT